MFLFIVSFFLVLTSSYFLVSAIKPKQNSVGIIYLFLTAFAQIILTFEILSLFSAIKQFSVLIVNLIFLGISLYFWNKNQRNLWILEDNGLKNRIINSLKLDRSLRFLFFGYCTFFLSSILLCFLMPINNYDALSYHVARSLFWIFQGNLNHFPIADIRNTCMPINSEILYSWLLLFVKRDLFIGFFAFIGYLISIISIFNILGFLGFCTRKRLWVIFILSSLPSVLIQVSGTETDIIIAGLVTASIFLFWYALKHNTKAPIFMASLAYAIAIGTKTTAIIMIPSVCLLFIFLSIKFKNFKPLIYFLISGFINFLIFASYTYILNFIDYSNFMGPASYIAINKNYYGLKGFISNFIKYIYMFIDFTGFKWSLYLNPYIEASQNAIFNFLHIVNIPDYYFSPKSFGNKILEPTIGMGVLGFMIYIPCILISIVKTRFSLTKSFFLNLYGVLFLINMVIISALLSYSLFAQRYFVAFIILSSPVLIYSYNIKFKPLKYLTILFALFYLIIMSINLPPRPLIKSILFVNKTHSLTLLREVLPCLGEQYCIVREKIKYDFKPNNKILVFSELGDNIYLLKKLEFEGYHIDFRRMPDASSIDFKKYNILISRDNEQSSLILEKDLNRQDDFKMINNKIIGKGEHDVPCLKINFAQYLSFPCFIKCTMGNDFLKKNNFVLYDWVKKFDKNDKQKHYYLIYVNNNNPPLRKTNAQ